jgi:hypothetical protein
MVEPLEPGVLATLRDVLSSDTPLTRRFALLEPTKKLARMLGSSEASLLETQPSSIGMPHGDLSSHCSRETRLAQAHEQGDSRDATPSLPR